MEIGCVFATYSLEIIGMLRLIRGEKLWMMMTTTILSNAQHCNNHFYGEFRMDVLLGAIPVQLATQTYKKIF